MKEKKTTCKFSVGPIFLKIIQVVKHRLVPKHFKNSPRFSDLLAMQIILYVRSWNINYLGVFMVFLFHVLKAVFLIMITSNLQSRLFFGPNGLVF